MIVIERSIWECKRHANMNLLIIYTYWTIVKNDKSFQNQEVINRRNKILKYCCKEVVLYAKRRYQISIKLSLSIYSQRMNVS